VDENLIHAIAIQIDFDWFLTALEGQCETRSYSIRIQYLLTQLNQITSFRMQDKLVGLNE
jgi:hypothetical protein